MMGIHDNESPLAEIFAQEHLHFEDNGPRLVSGLFAGNPNLSSNTKEDIYWVDNEGVAHFGKKEGKGTSTGGKTGSSSIQQKGFGWFVIALGIIAVIILLFVIIPTLNNPVKKVTKYLNNGNYSAAVKLYNTKIYGTEKKENQINSLIKEHINICGDEYFDNVSDYDTVVQNLTTFEGINKEEYSKLARGIITSIDSYIVDKGNFDNGVDLVNSSDYLNAMASFIKISKDSSFYLDAIENYYSCREILFEELADPKTEDDYESYINKLEGYLDVISADSAFKKRKTELEKGLAEMNGNSTITDNDSTLIETEYLDNCSILKSDEYQGNQGDSFVYPIGQHQFTRGRCDISGNTYYHGIEAWIARWNYEDEVSWAYSIFALPDNMKSLSGNVVLIDSRNTTNFDSTLFFINADTDKEIKSYHLTPDTIPFDFSISVSDVQKLKIFVTDNRAVSGGTSLGLVNAILTTAE